ncbi:MAG: class I SAM-dependent methyltransferase [Thermodesulfobacteriota bacterium]
MQENQASQTAQRVATHRAAHQLLDQPLVFDDPLAVDILGPQQAAALKADPQSSVTSPASPFLRAFTAARSRFAEDRLRRAVEQGVDQYVVLGAGLDTFAYRNPYPALRVFEVDHPATQAWKRARLAAAGIAAPPQLTFTPLDFHQQTLAQGLAAAGLDPARPSFFAWLGVTPYLTAEAVRQTLAHIAACPPGSGAALDYAVPPEMLDARSQQAFAALSQYSASTGEPWLSTFRPADMDQELRAAGLRQVEDLGQAEINARYFAGRTDGLRVGAIYHLVSAWV